MGPGVGLEGGGVKYSGKPARRTPGWPTKDGKPATEVEIREFIAKVEAHYMGPIEPTRPHFCHRCTMPLEFEPCPVCWGCHFKGKIADLRILLGDVKET